MMSTGASIEKNPLEMFTKWSEGHLGLLSERQRLLGEATQSVLGFVRDSLDRRTPEESLRRLYGSMLEFYNLPLRAVGNGRWEELSRDLRKLVAGAPFAVSGNGFSEELREYGKATWENGSRASSACMNWMKDLLREQKLTVDGKEAGQVVKSCLELTESFLAVSLECWKDQVKANSGLVRTSLPKEGAPAQPVQ